MPALWSPEELAARFSPYIEELHDVFIMHGLHYGEPEDVQILAARLEKPSLLSEELGALVRSIVLREGGTVPRTDLLEILAIAIAGPRMDPGGADLQQPVRQLLAFLHKALRRPWNEPPVEERSPAVDERKAYEENQERLSAAAGSSTPAPLHEGPPIQAPPPNAEDGAGRGNVIPFGRARAVFSRLVRVDAGMEGEKTETFDGASTAGAVPEEQRSTHETLPLETAEAIQVPSEAPEFVALEPAAELPPADEARRDFIAADALAEPVAQMEPRKESAESVLETEPRTEAAQLEESAGVQAVQQSPAPVATPVAVSAETAANSSSSMRDQIAACEVEPGMKAASDKVSAESAVPEKNSARVPAKEFLQSQPRAVSPPARATLALDDFDDEPPMPSADWTKPTRTILWSAAAVLVAAISFGLVLHGRMSSQGAILGSASTTAQPPAAAQIARPELGANAIPAIETAGPASHPEAAAKSSPHPFDDGYIAPPYSNLPPDQRTPQDTQAAQKEPGSGSGEQTAVAPAQLQSPKALPVSETRSYRDPDGMIAGDLPRNQTSALSTRPIHLRVAGAVMAANLIASPEPDFPMLARITHLDGPVVLQAEIGRNGRVRDTHVISGHRLLRGAAEDAVRQWRYRPYIVDGQPVAVTTTITVHFDQDR